MKAKAVKAKPYLLIAPSIVLLCVFCIYPIFSIISLSFYQWDMVTPFKKFVGLENFITLLGDAQFYRTLANTVIYVCLLYTSGAIVVSFVLGSLILALSGHNPLDVYGTMIDGSLMLSLIHI